MMGFNISFSCSCKRFASSLANTPHQNPHAISDVPPVPGLSLPGEDGALQSLVALAVRLDNVLHNICAVFAESTGLPYRTVTSS